MSHLILLASVCGRNLIDSTTPAEALTATPPNMTGYPHENLTLVMSEEFNVNVPPGGFSDKSYWNSETREPDVKWQATNQLSYDAGGDSFMSPRALEVKNGSLLIHGWKERYQGATYIGGQLTSWNRVCFQGGYMEVRYKNVGPWGAYGLWPAIWALGILLRDNYMIRNRNLWPYTYSDCQCPGSFFHGVGSPMAISACMPDPGFGMNAFQGRGAVEMDLLEQVQCSKYATSISDSYGVLPEDSCLIQTFQVGPRMDYTFRPMVSFSPSADRPWCACAASATRAPLERFSSGPRHPTARLATTERRLPSGPLRPSAQVRLPLGGVHRARILLWLLPQLWLLRPQHV